MRDDIGIDTTRPSRGVGCLLGCLRAIFAFGVVSIFATAIAIGGLWYAVEHGPFAAFGSMPLLDLTGEVAWAVADSIDEEPRFLPAPPAQRYPIDRSTPRSLVPPLVRAFDLMRATPDGARLFDLLVANDVQISIEPLAYNAGYTSTTYTGSGWIRSNIVIAADIVRTRQVEVLAAILVHEAVHADLAISGRACFYGDSCTTLSNGIQLEEEVAAHAVEARWWRDMFGDDGKRLALGAAIGENTLLGAWLKGETAFVAFVRDLRSDEREGDGI